jgi:hypothetical protein
MKQLSSKSFMSAVAALSLSASLANAQFLGLPIPVGDLAPAGLVTSLTSVAVGQGLPVVTTLLFSSPLTPAVVGLAPQASVLTNILLGNPIEELSGLIPVGSNPLEIISTSNPLAL